MDSLLVIKRRLNYTMSHILRGQFDVQGCLEMKCDIRRQVEYSGDQSNPLILDQRCRAVLHFIYIDQDVKSGIWQKERSGGGKICCLIPFFVIEHIHIISHATSLYTLAYATLIYQNRLRDGGRLRDSSWIRWCW